MRGVWVDEGGWAIESNCDDTKLIIVVQDKNK